MAKKKTQPKDSDPGQGAQQAITTAQDAPSGVAGPDGSVRKRKRPHKPKQRPGSNIKKLVRPPIRVSRHTGGQGLAAYGWIDTLDHIPTHAEVAGRYGTGRYKLECEEDGLQYWPIASKPRDENEDEEEDEAVGNEAKTMGEMGPLGMMAQLIVQQTEATHLLRTIQGRMDAVDGRLERLGRALVRLASTNALGGNGQAAAVPPPPRSLKDEIREMVDTKHALDGLGELFGGGGFVDDGDDDVAWLKRTVAGAVRDAVKGATSPAAKEEPKEAASTREAAQDIPGMTPEIEDELVGLVPQLGVPLSQLKALAKMQGWDGPTALAAAKRRIEALQADEDLAEVAP